MKAVKAVRLAGVPRERASRRVRDSAARVE
jgi:hypothetical protein